MKRLVLIPILIVLLAGAGLAAVRHGAKNPAALGLKALGEAAGQAYIYGYPLVLMDETRRAMLASDPDSARPVLQTNRLSAIRTLPQAGDEMVVRPNLDTLYALAWLDLSAGPLTLSVPDMGERYFVYQVMDAWTNVIAAPGSRTSGSGPDIFHIVRPGTPAPEGTGQRIEVPTRMAWIIGRIETAAAPDDLARVHALQDGFELRGPVPAGMTLPEPGEHRPPDTVAGLPPGVFFARLDALLEDNPAPARDGEMLDTLASLGIGPQAEARESRFGWLARRAMAKGVRVARARLAEAIDQRPSGPANWRTAIEGMGDYGTDYAMRAGVALIGLGANWPQDAVYPNTATDADGAALNGDHTYRIRFEPDALPPVRAFWSLTLYDEEGFLPDIAGARHAITGRDGLVYGKDGSLEVVVSARRPADLPDSNWLPAPAGAPFALTARLYWPREAVLSGEWRMPPVERLEAFD